MVNVTSSPLANGLELLADLGFFDVLLPMLFLFLLFYAILIKTSLLGDDDKAKVISAIISFIAGILFVTQTAIVAVFTNMMGRVALLMIVTLLILMLLVFTGVYKVGQFENKKAGLWIAIPVLLIFLGILDVSGVYIPGIHQIITSAFSGSMPKITREGIDIGIAVLLFVIIPLLVVWLVVKKAGGSGGD